MAGGGGPGRSWRRAADRGWRRAAREEAPASVDGGAGGRASVGGGGERPAVARQGVAARGGGERTSGGGERAEALGLGRKEEKGEEAC